MFSKPIDEEEDESSIVFDHNTSQVMLQGMDLMNLTKNILDENLKHKEEQERVAKAKRDHDKLFANETEAEKNKLQDSIKSSKRNSQASAMSFVR